MPSPRPIATSISNRVTRRRPLDMALSPCQACMPATASLPKVRPALVARLPVFHVEAGALPYVARGVNARTLRARVLVALRTATIAHQHHDIRDCYQED